MKPFKFLGGEVDIFPLPPNDNGWMWDGEYIFHEINGYHWELHEMLTNGIDEFLNSFPNGMVIPVHSITSNGIRHGFNTHRNGWGFDITSDPLVFEYYKLIPNEI